MGSILKHTIKRVECKRDKEDLKNYKLSYHFDIPKIKIENKALRIDYAFSVFYNEDLGSITVEGSLLYKDTLNKLKELEGNWGKNVEFSKRIYNIIFRNSVFMVADLSRHVGLPSPVFLPEINPNQEPVE